MKAFLLGSLALNLLLAVVVVYQGYRASDRSNAELLHISDGGQTKQVPLQHLESATPAASFRWSQLDAPDFPSFIRNLRSAGCPEATIRDIVQGELREIYSVQTQVPIGEGAARVVDLTPDSTAAGALHGFEEVVQLTAELLNATQAGMEASIGEALPITQEQHASAQMSGQAQPQAPAPTIPTAFLVGNHPQAALPTSELSLTTTDPSLSSATASMIQKMRSQFADTLGNSSSGDAKTYSRDWLVAQRQSDEFFASMFGGDAMIAAQAAAAQKRAAELRALNSNALRAANE